MKTFKQEELDEIIRKHGLWLKDLAGGERANLRYANLRYANLSSANLRYANLSSANLSSADLSSANLSSADLQAIKEDFIGRLLPLKNESVGLYKAIIDGKIDGSSYEGECCCFVGTVAKNRNVHYRLMDELKPDSDSATERFFMGISKGDTPENNQISAVLKTWLEEFMAREEIKIPTRTIQWAE